MYLHCGRCGARTTGWDVNTQVRASATPAESFRMLLGDGDPGLTNAPTSGESPQRQSAVPIPPPWIWPPTELRLSLDD